MQVDSDRRDASRPTGAGVTRAAAAPPRAPSSRWRWRWRLAGPRRCRRRRPAAQSAKAPRIVALTPFAANTLAKLGVIPVGDRPDAGRAERFSPKLKGVKVLPLSHPNGPNLEQLASLDPDLVLSSPTWAKGNQAMENLGIQVVVHEPRLDRRRLRRHLQDRPAGRPQATRRGRC